MRALKTGLVVLGVAGLALTACSKKTETAAPGAAGGNVAAGGPVDAAALPHRKAGLWSQTITSKGMKAPMTVKICLDAATDAQMSLAGAQASKDVCPDNKMMKTAGGYSFSATCNMGTGGKVVSSGNMTGDFNSAYQVVANTTTTGAQVAQMNRSSSVTIAAKWEGPCPEGMAPGDQELPNGMRINMMGFDPAKAAAIAKEQAAAKAAAAR